ncbi:glutathione S-transferase [Musa troglodytarum]|uniref:glutathione transferase n=1 Tax=Musa troglodytarum TaxID=320322 RepID=A0A9E7G9L5_9LILI|nr:glutathione S-transferase [Musa troglodytarum]
MARPANLTLYSYYWSSCAHRVRIALNLKGLEYEYKAVNLLKGDQFDPEFEKINPLKFVPALVDGDVVVADSLAIILYLEDKYPQHPLLPQDLKKKAMNLQQFFEKKISLDEKLTWSQYHVNKGFAAIEKLIKEIAGKYATGDEVQLADVFLAPQIFAGVPRFQIDMSLYPTLARLNEAYAELPAFQAALPHRQPDAPSTS